MEDRARKKGGPRGLDRFSIPTTAVVLILVASVFLHLIGLRLPWRGPIDSIGSWNSHNADFLIRHGPAVTKLAFVESAGAVDVGEIRFRHTHPSFIIVWLALFRSLFGTGEGASRIGGVALSIVLILFTYLTARLLTDRPRSLIVLLAASLLPMEAYWGRLPSETLAAATCMTGAVFFYLSYRLKGARRWAALFFIFHFLGCSSDWIAYLLPPCLLFFELLTRRRSLVVPVTAVALNFVYFGLFLLQGYSAEGSLFFREFFAVGASWRLAESIGIAPGLLKVLVRIGLYFTVPLCLCAAVWLYRAVGMIRSGATDPDTRYRFLVPSIFLFIFLFWTAAFPRHVIAHEVLLHPLSPFFPLALGLVLPDRPVRRDRAIIVVLFLILFIAQLAAVLSLRFSQQKGYPVDYPLAVAAGSATAFPDHVMTHVVLAGRYYQFYCDRDLLMGVNSVDEFVSTAATGRYTTYLALDLDSFLNDHPEIERDAARFTELHDLAVDRELISFLRERYPSRKVSYFWKFDLTGKDVTDR